MVREVEERTSLNTQGFCLNAVLFYCIANNPILQMHLQWV